MGDRRTGRHADCINTDANRDQDDIVVVHYFFSLNPLCNHIIENSLGRSLVFPFHKVVFRDVTTETAS